MPIKTNRIEETRLLMLSDTFLLWLARACHVGGSFGLTARDLAASIMAQEPSMIAFPA